MKNLIKKSISEDEESIKLLFRQFIDENEEIVSAHYYGLNGIWHFGLHSFACITNRRTCSIKIGWLGYVDYGDVFLEDTNLIRVNQPSLFILLLWVVLFLLITLGLGIFFLPWFIRFFYRFNKSGATIYSRSSEKVFIFCDRKKIKYLDRLLRKFSAQREARLLEVFGISRSDG